jgi:hypothetical protein
MVRKIIFCASTQGKVVAREHGCKAVLSGYTHPLDNHQLIRRFKDGKTDVIVADETMATGWRAEGADILVEFDRSWPYDLKSAYTIQANARAVGTVPFAAGDRVLPPVIEKEDDGGE